MGNIIEASQLPEKDKVYMKKDYFGWRVVQPIRDENGKLNWVNLIFGGKRNALFTLLLIVIILFVMWSYNHDVQAIQKNYATIAADPIAWCKDVNAHPENFINKYNISVDIRDFGFKG